MSDEIIFEEDLPVSTSLSMRSEADGTEERQSLGSAYSDISLDDEVEPEQVVRLRNRLGQTFFKKVEQPDIVLQMMMDRDRNTDLLYQIDAFRKLMKYKDTMTKEENRENSGDITTLRSKKIGILETFIFEIKQAKDIDDMIKLINSFLQNNGELYGFRSDSVLIQYLYPRSKTERLLAQLQNDIDTLVKIKNTSKGSYINDHYSLPELSAFKRLYNYQEKLHRLSKSNWVNGTVRKVSLEKYYQLNRLTSKLASVEKAEDGKKLLIQTVKEQPILTAHNTLPYVFSGFSSEPKSVSLIKELQKSLINMRKTERSYLNDTVLKNRK